VRVKVASRLLIIDGDNNNGTNLPDTKDQEAVAARPNPDADGKYEYPGKIVIVNDGDIDNDGVPDYAAGFNQVGQTQLSTVAGVPGNKLVPIQVLLPDGVDPKKAVLRFTYQASSPLQVKREGAGTWEDSWGYWVAPNSDKDPGYLRLWIKDGTESRDFETSFVASEKEYPASYFFREVDGGRARSMTLYVEAVRPSVSLADLFIALDIYPDGADEPLGLVYSDIVRLTAIDLGIALDNRTGEQGEVRYVDTTTAERPFPFWVNDDHDYHFGETSDGLAANDAPSYLYPLADLDNSNRQILMLRDLEDFLSFQITASLLHLLGPDYKLRLSFGHAENPPTPGIQVFAAPAGSLGPSYLFDQGKAQQTLGFANSSFVGRVDSSPIFLDSSLLNDSAEHRGIRQFLLEGLTSRRGALQIELLKIDDRGEASLGRDEAYLDIQPMHSPATGPSANPDNTPRDLTQGRYDHFTVGDRTTGAPLPTPITISRGVHVPQPPPRPSIDLSDRSGLVGAAIQQGITEPPSDYVLFVHGWRVTTDERRAFAETSYKRLFWQGYRGDFGLFSWPTEWTPLVLDFPGPTRGGIPEDMSNYNRSEELAWNSANGLLGVLDVLAGAYSSDRVNVFAHSMGNVVVSEALRKHT